MTRALAMAENQVRAIMRAAKKEHVTIQVKIGDAVVTVIPASHAQPEGAIDATPSPEAFETLDEYEAWRQRSRARED